MGKADAQQYTFAVFMFVLCQNNTYIIIITKLRDKHNIKSNTASKKHVRC